MQMATCATFKEAVLSLWWIKSVHQEILPRVKLQTIAFYKRGVNITVNTNDRQNNTKKDINHRLFNSFIAYNLDRIYISHFPFSIIVIRLEVGLCFVASFSVQQHLGHRNSSLSN